MSPTLSELQAAPGEERLTAIAEAVSSGSSVVSIRHLSGGLGNGMHVLDLSLSDSQHCRVVLRRFSEDERSLSDTAIREWRVLKLMQKYGIEAPEPLFLDSDGSVVGTPAIVISFVHGKPILRPSDASNWEGQVATAVRALHSIAGVPEDVGFLGQARQMGETVAARCADAGRFRRHPLGERLRGAMLEAITDVSPVDTTVVHGDFWPGNILWHEGRLLAVVDWTDAELRDPAQDVGYMWMDLMLTGENDAAEEFTERYAQLIGGPIPNLRLAKMLAMGRAMPDPGRWLPGWVSLGKADLKAEQVRSVFTTMIEQITQ